MIRLKLEDLSERIVDSFFYDSSKEEKEVMSFGLLALLSTLVGYILIIILSYLVGVTLFSLVAVLSFSLLRVYSGGLHFSTLKGCIFSSAIIFTLVGLKVDYFINFLGKEELRILLWIVFLFSSLIIYFYSPAQVEENIIENELKRWKLKVNSFLVLFLLLLIYLITLSLNSLEGVVLAGLLGILLQSFSMTPLAYRLYRKKYIRG